VPDIVVVVVLPVGPDVLPAEPLVDVPPPAPVGLLGPALSSEEQ
jgi:hypothetical protein